MVNNFSDIKVLTTINTYLIQILPNTLAMIGLFGSTLVIYIMTRPSFIKIPMFRYFIVNEVLNLFCFVLTCVWFGKIWLNYNTSDMFCQTWEFLGYTTYSIYPWINALNSVDRLVSFKYSTKFEFRKKLNFQIIIIGTIFVVALLCNVPYFVFFQESNTPSVCEIETPFRAFLLYSTTIVLADTIPLLIMITTTILILQYLVEQKKKIQRNKKNFKREIQFVKSVLIMDIWLAVCLIPFCVINLSKSIFGLNGISYNFWQLLHDCVEMLIIIHSSFSFFLYLICNKLFREYFFSMIKNVDTKKQFFSFYKRKKVVFNN